MNRVRLLSLTTFGLAVALCGCSSNKSLAPARISGSISYKGKPIKGGALRFYTPEGTAYEGLISSDGTYTATDIPTGELVVTVDTEVVNSAQTQAKGAQADARLKASQTSMSERPGNPGGGGTPPPPPADLYVKIPKVYANPKTSPLTVTVKAGRHIHNIELTGD